MWKKIFTSSLIWVSFKAQTQCKANVVMKSGNNKKSVYNSNKKNLYIKKVNVTNNFICPFMYLSVYCFVATVAALSQLQIFLQRQANDKVKNKVKWTEFNFFRFIFFFLSHIFRYKNSYKFTLHFIHKKKIEKLCKT